MHAKENVFTHDNKIQFYAIAAQGYEDAVAAEKKVDVWTTAEGTDLLPESNMESIVVYSSDLYPVDKERQNLEEQDRIELKLEGVIPSSESAFLPMLFGVLLRSLCSHQQLLQQQKAPDPPTLRRSTKTLRSRVATSLLRVTTGLLPLHQQQMQRAQSGGKFIDRILSPHIQN